MAAPARGTQKASPQAMLFGAFSTILIEGADPLKLPRVGLRPPNLIIVIPQIWSHLVTFFFQTKEPKRPINRNLLEAFFLREKPFEAL